MAPPPADVAIGVFGLPPDSCAATPSGKSTNSTHRTRKTIRDIAPPWLLLLGAGRSLRRQPSCERASITHKEVKDVAQHTALSLEKLRVFALGTRYT